VHSNRKVVHSILYREHSAVDACMFLFDELKEGCLIAIFVLQ